MGVVACAVMFSSSAQTSECLLGIAVATAGILVFVVRTKPFDDGNAETPEHLTGAD